MPSFQQVKILPYQAQDLFNLVLDIESYPQFIPGCSAVEIILADSNHLIAELMIKVKGFTDKYQSKIIFSTKEFYLIEVEAISGPFIYLKNLWKFFPQKDSTKVEFFIDFKMKSYVLEKLAVLFLPDITSRIIDAFEKRAQDILRPLYNQIKE